MTEEALILEYVRHAFNAAARRGISPIDLAHTMLVQSAAVIRCREGSARFVEVMDRCTSLLDDEASAEEQMAIQ